MEETSVTTIVAWGAFATGLIFGATAQKTHFCTMGALSDVVFMGDYRRLRAWFLAIAVAILGTQALHALGHIDLTQSIYLSPNLGWLGAILGGLMFGFGMTMAGGCGNKTLVRIGGGNLKSIVVFMVMGITAYMTLRGLFGLARVDWIEPTAVDLGGMGLESQGMVSVAAALTGLEADSLRWIVSLVVAGALLFYCFKDAAFRTSPAPLISGLIIGLLIPAGWAVTGILGFDDFEPTQLMSFTFVAPSGESLQYLMTFTGATINFGIASVGGVIFGSFIAALATKGFNVEAFAGTDDMLRHLFGAVLMGVGGVTALGCTIGQGLTGVSTLSMGSFLALGSILFGGVLGLKRMEEGSMAGALRALFTKN